MLWENSSKPRSYRKLGREGSTKWRGARESAGGALSSGQGGRWLDTERSEEAERARGARNPSGSPRPGESAEDSGDAGPVAGREDRLSGAVGGRHHEACPDR
jgi:hypothetical protein